MANIWPVENIWSIVREMVKSKEPKNKAQLNTIITRVWREINSDKELCKRLMQSIPGRLEAVIAKEGTHSGKLGRRMMRWLGKNSYQFICQY
jgi:hypothetical protein